MSEHFSSDNILPTSDEVILPPGVGPYIDDDDDLYNFAPAIPTHAYEKPLPSFPDTGNLERLSPEHNTVNEIAEHLGEQGEPVDYLFIDKFDDTLVKGLAEVNESGTAEEYLRQSNRFAVLHGANHIFKDAPYVEIPQSADNVHDTGKLREEETGKYLDIDKVVGMGVDPSHVLFFRVTQPATEGPKPEYYWTSDPGQVHNGLRVELGDKADSAMVMVSTLADIAKNGGLMRDINDDSGVAVRQMGLEPYDQSRALLHMKRAPK